MGWMYLGPILTFYSRKVVGWAIDTHMRSELVETVLKRALWNRKPPKGLWFIRIKEASLLAIAIDGYSSIGA